MFRHLAALSLLLHAVLAWRLLPALATLSPWAAWPMGGWLLASAWLLPKGFGRDARDRRGATLIWAGLLAMGLFSSLFVLTLLRDAALLLAAAAHALAGAPPLPPGAAPWSAATVVAVALAISLVGFVNARRTAGVRRQDLPIDGLPAALDGFLIVQLSDVHVGPTIKRPYVQAIVDAVNRLGADMVAITGDLVDGSVPALAHDVAPLAGLRARHGSFFVTGNHEYYAGAQAWVEALRRLGLTVLMNQHVVLRHGSAPQQAELVVAGVTDYTAHVFDPSQRSDPAAALAGAPPGVPRLLLAHQPRSAQAAADAGFDVQLSGHTHGGQFLPWNFFVPLQQPFVAGLRRVGRLRVYTSRGTGYWGPPLRFGAPSEITLLRLVPLQRAGGAGGSGRRR